MVTFIFQRGWRCLQFGANGTSVHLRTKFPTSKKIPCYLNEDSMMLNPFKDEAQTALFKDPVRTTL
jgi:hypothetical protein